jgi:hypothetical protein
VAEGKFFPIALANCVANAHSYIVKYRLGSPGAFAGIADFGPALVFDPVREFELAAHGGRETFHPERENQ